MKTTVSFRLGVVVIGRRSAGGGGGHGGGRSRGQRCHRPSRRQKVSSTITINMTCTTLYNARVGVPPLDQHFHAHTERYTFMVAVVFWVVWIFFSGGRSYYCRCVRHHDALLFARPLWLAWCYGGRTVGGTTCFGSGRRRVSAHGRYRKKTKKKMKMKMKKKKKSEPCGDVALSRALMYPSHGTR